MVASCDAEAKVIFAEITFAKAMRKEALAVYLDDYGLESDESDRLFDRMDVNKKGNPAVHVSILITRAHPIVYSMPVCLFIVQHSVSNASHPARIQRTLLIKMMEAVR